MGDRSPRQTAKLNKQKNRVVSAAVVDNKKRAVASPTGNGSSYDLELRFRFDRVDLGSDWCLTDISKSDHAALISFMAEMESKKLRDLIPGRCKRVNVADDSKNSAARKRAQQQFSEDHDAIHELHIDGPKRLWGLLYDNEFSIIWWDPEHVVFPSKFVWQNTN